MRLRAYSPGESTKRVGLPTPRLRSWLPPVWPPRTGWVGCRSEPPTARPCHWRALRSRRWELARAPVFIATALINTFYPHIAREARLARGGSAHAALLGVIAAGVLPLNVILGIASATVVLFFFPERYSGAATSLTILAVGSAFL